jgi:hypothetical protein
MPMQLLDSGDRERRFNFHEKRLKIDQVKLKVQHLQFA